MSNPGQSKDFPVAPGAAEWKRLKAEGFSDEALAQWRAEETAKFRVAKFSQQKIDEYWGDARGKGDGIKTLARVNLSRAQAADDPWEYLQAGFGVTAAGLLKSGGAPKYVLPENASIFAQTMAALGQVAGDAPIAIPAFWAGMAPGAAAGGAIGAATGAPAAGAGAVPGAVVGATIGGAITGGFAAGAAPVAAREAVLNAYAAGDIDNPDEFWARLTHSVIETGKAGTIGAITSPIGGAVGRKVTATTGKVLFGAAADITTQGVGGAAIGGALNGRMPTKDDIVVGVVTGIATEAPGLVVRSVKGRETLTEAGKHAKHNVETIYRRTGVHPREAGERARTNPVMRQELVQQDVTGDPVIPRHIDEAPPEVEGYKAPQTGQEAAPGARKFGGAREATDAGAKLLRDFEGFRETAYWDVNHWRTGYGSDTVTNPDGTFRKTVKGDRVDLAGAERDLSRRLRQQFLPSIREQVGAHWDGLDTNSQAALLSVAYNYGRLPSNVVRAIRSEDPEQIAQAVEKLRFHNDGVNKDRRQKEADMIRGGGGGKGGDGGGEPPAGGEGGLPVPFGKRKPLAERTPEEAAAEDAAWRAKSAEERYAEARKMVADKDRGDLFELLDPNRAIDQFVSELRPARMIDNEIFENHPEFSRKNTYGIEDAMRNTYGSNDRTYLALKHGPVDGETNTVPSKGWWGDGPPPSMQRAVDVLKKAGGKVEEWGLFMLALRTVEKDAQGIKTGMDPALAKSMVEDPKEFNKYKEATAIFQQVGIGILKYAVAKGRYSPEQATRMVKNNLFWVSMRRAQGDHESFKPAARGHFKVGAGIRRMEGSDQKVVNPFMASIDNWQMIMSDADRNEGIGAVVQAAKGGLIPPEWGIEHAYTIGEGELSKSTDLAPYVTPDEVQELTQALAPDLAIQSFNRTRKPNEFIWFNNGKAEVYRTKSEALARLLNASDSLGEANFIIAGMQGFAAIKRAGITSPIEFILKNILSDQIGAFVTDPSHPPPFLTLALGAIPALTHNKTWKNWVAAGGAGAAAVSMDQNFLTRDMAKLFDQTGVTEKVWNVARSPLDFMQTVQERVDAAQRIGGWVWSQKVGKMEPRRAAMQSRKTYIDFREQATLRLANQWAKISTFLRPFLLGWKNIAEAAAERPLETGLALTLAGLTSVGFALLNIEADKELDEDEKWANNEDWKKDQFISTPPIFGMRFKIGARDAVGLTNSFAWRLTDYLAKNDKEAFDGIAGFFAKQFFFDLTPAAVQPVVSHVTNYNTFLGRPMIPSTLEKVSGPMQYTENTTETAKKLALWINSEADPLAKLGLDSPMVVENYVRGWLGGTGINVMRQLDPGDPATQRPPEITDNPFVNAFVHRNPRANAQPISDFYDAYEELRKVQADERLAMKRENVEELERAQASPVYGLKADEVADYLSDTREALAAINRDATMNVHEKRQFSEQLYTDMILAAREGLEIIREYKAEGERIKKEEKAVGPLSAVEEGDIPAVPPVAPNAGQMALA